MGWTIDVLAVGLLVVGGMLLLVARNNLRLRRRLTRRERRLADSLILVEMAEQLAEFGRWQTLPDGGQEWSAGLCRIAGFPPGFTPDRETRLQLLPDGGAHFYGVLERHKRDTKPFAFEFEIDRFDGERRMVRVFVQNTFDRIGRLTGRQGVTLDITERHRAIEMLAKEKSEAVAAAEEALKLADTDPLTGLANRRRTMAEADRAALAAARDGEPLALILLDIDHFKSVNDSHGHQTGDAVLVQVSEIIRKIVRAEDVVGRIGGEEFLCVLPGADLAVARQCAERLRRGIAETSGAKGLPPVTISVGFAGWRKGDSTLTLFARTDAALYDAKRAGRDCVRRAA